MIDFSQQTYQNILQKQLNRVSDTLDKREGSMIYTALGPESYALEDFYLALDRVQTSAFLQTAQGDALDRLTVIAGVTREQATAAVRLGIFNVEVPIGARFSTADGENSVNFTATEKISAGRYRMTCETPGTIGNYYTGPILPVTVIQGLNSAQIADILIPGSDTETDESLRERAISQLNESPFGGNVSDYKRVIMGIDGVGAVQVYPTWNGGGTVKCSILGADFNPASEELIQNVQNTVDPPLHQGLGYGTAPIGATVTIATASEETVEVSATLLLESGYEIGQVQEPVEQAVESYLLGLRQNWGNHSGSSATEYQTAVYVARVTSAILSVPGIANATQVQLNGAANDLILTETGEVQQIPVLGTVTLRV